MYEILVALISQVGLAMIFQCAQLLDTVLKNQVSKLVNKQTAAFRI